LLPSTLKQFFLPRRYLQRRNDILTPTGTMRGRREWVISRALCHYRLFSLTDIPPSRRDSVIELKIKQWAPFREYRHYAIWQEDQVQVWVWDQQKQQNVALEMGIAKAVVLPETVLRSPNRELSSVRLIECLEGVEGQVWQKGLLKGSHWWPQLPNPTEWERFQRHYGLPGDTQVPSLIQQPLLIRPWGKPKATLSRFSFYRESVAVLLGISIFLVLLTWRAVDIWKWQQATAQLQPRIEELSALVEPILTARTQALTAQQQLQQFLTLSPYPSQLTLMAKVAEKIPHRKDVRLIEWSYQLGELSFTIEAEKQDPTFYVKSFQEEKLFKDVRTETNKGNNAKQLGVNMKLEIPKDMKAVKVNTK